MHQQDSLFVQPKTRALLRPKTVISQQKHSHTGASIMARIRRDHTEDASAREVPRRTRTPALIEPETTSPPPTTRRRPARYVIYDDSDVEEEEVIAQTAPKVKENAQRKKTQVRLAPLVGLQSSLGSVSTTNLADEKSTLPRNRVQRRVLIQWEYLSARREQKMSSSADRAPCEDVEEEDVEESIWRGSASDLDEDSEEELPSMRQFFHAPRTQQESDRNPSSLDLSKQMQALAIFDDVGEKRPSKSSPKKKSGRNLDIASIFDDEDREAFTKSIHLTHSSLLNEVSRRGSSSDKENIAAIIRFSPPRNLNPINSQTALERPSTPPPQSPSKSRLKSPSKPRTRIPTPPHRPSLDAFWTAGTVNEWNDQYSPKKILKSPRKPLFQPASSSRDSASPPPSPSKLRSPTKAETALRKEFVARREDLARSFLGELDDVITQGRVGALASSTGGVQLVWSKTLTSTAGRANWKKETTKTRDTNSSQPSQVLTSTEKHYATIELATKVIDDEDRLLNVLAHEFCHLANFMVSGIKDQPHGKSFKEWGAKATRAFKGRGVEVTTKHSYAIDYKYVWACGGWDGCGAEFKRHSKSIDVSRHRCGVCKGDLVQIKPLPRGAGKGSTVPLEPGHKSEKPVVTGYAAYVKLHFASVKKGLPVGSTHKDAMQALSKKYQAEKAAAGSSSPPVDDVIIDVVKELGAVTLGSSRSPIDLD